jgi:hypothetical protein
LKKIFPGPGPFPGNQDIIFSIKNIINPISTTQTSSIKIYTQYLSTGLTVDAVENGIFVTSVSVIINSANI